MSSLVVHIYHNRTVSEQDIESLFVPIFGSVYSYSSLLNMSDHVWCAYTNDHLIGCILAKESRQATMLYVILFGIAKIYRSLGIGSHLLTMLIRYAEQELFQCIFLHTECSNLSAISFYQKFHFHIDQRLNNYYQTMSNFYPHAYRMIRTL